MNNSNLAKRVRKITALCEDMRLNCLITLGMYSTDILVAGLDMDNFRIMLHKPGLGRAPYQASWRYTLDPEYTNGTDEDLAAWITQLRPTTNVLQFPPK